MSKFRDEAYYANLDKRTKEYKQWKEFVEKQQAEEPKGLGDVVAKVTEVTGIKKAVEAFFGEDCGCDDRQDFLNKKLPFARGVLHEMSEEDYWFLKEIFSRPERGRAYTKEELTWLIDIYNHVYGKRESYAACESCHNNTQKKAIYKLEKYFMATNEFIDNQP